MNLRCIFGLHDFFAIYPNLMADKKESYVMVKRICLNCKKKEEFIIKVSKCLQDWDVLFAAPNFKSEEWRLPPK